MGRKSFNAGSEFLEECFGVHSTLATSGLFGTNKMFRYLGTDPKP